ncbi:MAG: hypothetical protein ABI042_16725 [Verrucomicrobiota bacterium]
MNTHQLTHELKEAIRKLYTAFAQYSPRHPEGCPCCVSDEDKRRLLSKPLNALTVDDVSRYSLKALTTWGTVNDFKHFLPRLLELMATDECSAIEPEVLMSKLRLASWQGWPEAERAGVDQFIHALWGHCLTAEAGSVWVDELLCGLGRGVDDLLPFLHAWMNCQSNMGYAHLLHFIDWNSEIILKRRHLQNSFWSDAEQQMSQVVTWLCSPETIRALEEIFSKTPDSNFATELATVVDRLAALQQTIVTNRTSK